MQYEAQLGMSRHGPPSSENWTVIQLNHALWAAFEFAALDTGSAPRERVPLNRLPFLGLEGAAEQVSLEVLMGSTSFAMEGPGVP